MVVSLGLNTRLIQRLGHWKYRIQTFGQTPFLEVPKHRLIGTVFHSWSRIRQTEGWAGLQHHSVLHSVLTIVPPTNSDHNGLSVPPRLQVNLIQGSFFTILPKSGGNNVPKWYSGNIYLMERSLPRIIDLPSIPSSVSPTSYDVFVSGDYEASALRSFIFVLGCRLAHIGPFPDTAVWGPTGVQWD
jgi:hypothetical protein